MGKITTSGLNNMRSLLVYDQMAIGTGTNAPTEADAALQTEILRATATQENGGNGEVISVMRINTSQGNGNTFTEAGDLKSSVLEDRHVFAGVAKTSAIQVEFRLKTKFQNA